MVKGELVKTITSDGIELQGFWTNKNSKIAIFHSHGTAGDFYTHKFIDVEARRLSSEGISFLTANNRGHDVYADLRKYHKIRGALRPKGRSLPSSDFGMPKKLHPASKDAGFSFFVHKNSKVEWVTIGSAFERFEDCIFDVGAWIDFLEKQGVKKVILQGHSLGPNKNVYYQYKKKDKRVIGQILISPCNDAGMMLYSLGKKRYDEANKMIENMVKNGKERKMLSSKLAVVCPMSAIAYYGYLTEQGEGNTFPYHNTNSPKWKMLQKIKEPLLAIFGGSDAYIKPSINEAARLLKEKAKSSNVATKIIKGAAHSYVGYEDDLIGIIMWWLKETFVK